MPPPPSTIRRPSTLSIAGLLAFTGAIAAVLVARVIDRYDAFASGWSWDLAYYNQWFWAATIGDGSISIRPVGPWTLEGPSIFVMNYLTPIRAALIPVYALFPSPRTLLVIQTFAIVMLIPAAYRLLLHESGEASTAAAGSALVLLFPLLHPLAVDDFRELQLALPFIVIAVDGVRGRSIGATAIGAAGLLACRQEFAVMVATLGFLPPREPEDAGRRERYRRALWLVGVGWFVLVFLPWCRWTVHAQAWFRTINVFQSSFPLETRLVSAARLLWSGCGVWLLLAAAAPRAALLALPWVWQVSGGNFGMQQLEFEQWHHVRYTAPVVGLMIAAGCIGLARIDRLATRLGGRRARLGALLGLLILGIPHTARIRSIEAMVPTPVSHDEVAELRRWIDEVAPDDAVLVHYDLSAPLSSRRFAFSYLLDSNKPPGYPLFAPEFAWAFVKRRDAAAQHALRQGFDLVHDGRRYQVWRRPSTAAAAGALPGLEPLERELARRAAAARDSAMGGTTPWLSGFADNPGGTVALILIEMGRLAALALPAVVWAILELARVRRPSKPHVVGSLAADDLVGAPEAASQIQLTDVVPTDRYDPPTTCLRFRRSTWESRSAERLVRVARETIWSGESRRAAAWIRWVVEEAFTLSASAGLLLILGALIMLDTAPARLGLGVISASVLFRGAASWILERTIREDLRRKIAALGLDAADLASLEEAAGVSTHRLGRRFFTR
ncbi:MAG: DUF2079 domain-containing protein [Isosphaeraceae bacterium]|nr:DUF2079 domain-containing protein [Isosphaeraceae bacterium]